MPAEIQVDERLLQHIFTNLLTNAVKYSDVGRVVRFEVGLSEKEIVCVVRDEGIGIPEADREWLFSAFHRAQNVGDRPGTGLGLVIVKRCVDLHGGKINIPKIQRRLRRSRGAKKHLQFQPSIVDPTYQLGVTPRTLA